MSDNISNIGTNALGVGAGATLYYGSTKLIDKTLIPAMRKHFSKALGDVYTKEELQDIRTAVYDSLKKSGLQSNGYTIYNLNNQQKVDAMIKRGEKEILTKYKKGSIRATNKIKKLIEKVNTIYNGHNASCGRASKSVIINMDKIPAAAFHEMGHALNASGKGLGKILSKIRNPIAKWGAIFILGIGLLKPQKTEGEESQGIIDKSTTFIKNNVGKLTFAAMIPKLLEEGLASIKGGKLAKQAGLSKDLLKKINTGNIKAWMTYLICTLVTSGLARLAVNVRDKATEKMQKQQSV